jgi:hypothetical protein
MVLKLVPMGIDGVLIRLMQERCGSRPSASIEEWRKILNDLVAGERAENERLRAALSGILLWWDRPNGPSRGRLVYLIEAARAALKGANLAEKS